MDNYESTTTRRRPFKQEGWLPYGLDTSKLINLRQMLEVCATEYARIGEAIQSFSDNLAVNVGLEEPLSKNTLESVKSNLTDIRWCGEQLNLAVCVGLVSQYSEAYQKTTPTYQQAGEDMRTLKKVFYLELEIRRFFFVPDEWAKYYCVNILPFDTALGSGMKRFELVIEKFPSTENDIREAGNCLALERPTASVFHLMRVMESGLKAVAMGLGITPEKSWGQYLEKIDTQMRQRTAAKSPEWAESEKFYRDVAAQLTAIKRAWRNPTMHIERTYTREEAKYILVSVEAFMLHLATRISEV